MPVDPFQVYESLVAEGYRVTYMRIPLTDGACPLARDFDMFYSSAAAAGPSDALIYTCQARCTTRTNQLAGWNACACAHTLFALFGQAPHTALRCRCWQLAAAHCRACLPLLLQLGGGRTTTGMVIGSLLRMHLNGARIGGDGGLALGAAATAEHMDEDVGGVSPRGGSDDEDVAGERTPAAAGRAVQTRTAAVLGRAGSAGRQGMATDEEGDEVRRGGGR